MNQVMEAQERLFNMIKSHIPEQSRLVDVIGESLQVGADSAYRRIRGEKELSFSELRNLCHTFHLSMDELLNYDSEQGALFRYTSIKAEQPNYVRYIKQLLETFKAPVAVDDRELFFTAQDIPFYHFLNQEQLLLFKLYVCYDSSTPERISFREFYDRMDLDVCLPLHEQLLREYQQIPSKEIWTEQTVNTILHLLDFYMEIGAFDSKTILLLLRQLLELLDRISHSAEIGYKDAERHTPFSLYICSIDPGSSMVLARHGSEWMCTVKLYTANCVTTNNIALCNETRKWINNLIMKSSLISGGTSERERFRFFQTSKDKVEALIRKAEQIKFS
ncbi:MAG: hypothetical protein LBB90_03615 [Tannerella sp.]|jgi:hypothetical protein|nr:hypothetical protein [Tannerella sp.]